MSFIQRWSLTVAAALALATPVSAQWKPVADAAAVQHVPAAFTSPSAPELSLMGSTTMLQTWEASEPGFIAPPLPGVERTSTDVALMIVGGAALILGSVIGDDAGALMMVGGGVVGLVGLYQYLT
jgi:hypothetical protein